MGMILFKKRFLQLNLQPFYNFIKMLDDNGFFVRFQNSFQLFVNPISLFHQIFHKLLVLNSFTAISFFEFILKVSNLCQVEGVPYNTFCLLLYCF